MLACRAGSALAAAALALALTVPRAAGQAQNAPAYHVYRGAIHIHTEYSDGSGTFPEVVEAARASGLDYIIASDHNTLQPVKDGHQRYWDDLLVLIGTEISTDAGHVLGLDLPESFPFETRDPQQAIDRVRAAGGFSVIAHPMSPRWLWRDWSVRGYTGIEIINLSSLVDDDLMNAQEGLRIQQRSVQRLLRLARRYTTDPDGVMKTITNNDVEPERGKWSELLGRGRQMISTGAVDAHARVPLGRQVLKVPTYQEAFESVSTYAVTTEPLSRSFERDRRLVYSAYRNGRIFAAYPRVAPAAGFRFTATSGGRTATMGQPLRLAQRAVLRVEAPDHASPVIRLLRDAAEVKTAEGQTLEWTATQPGAYRVEVYAVEGSGGNTLLDRVRRRPRSLTDLFRSRPQELRPWIFSNPVYVR
ncbi:MAG: PHP domain-containing protein [Armatimonadota bacterium]